MPTLATSLTDWVARLVGVLEQAAEREREPQHQIDRTHARGLADDIRDGAVVVEPAGQGADLADYLERLGRRLSIRPGEGWHWLVQARTGGLHFRYPPLAGRR